MLLNLQSTIANEQARFLEFDGDLKPLARHAWVGLLLLLNKSTRLGFTDPLPALVSGDFGVIAIGHEEREVRIHKVSQAQSGCLKRSENCHRHWHLSHMRLQSSSGRGSSHNRSLFKSKKWAWHDTWPVVLYICASSSRKSSTLLGLCLDASPSF